MPPSGPPWKRPTSPPSFARRTISSFTPLLRVRNNPERRSRATTYNFNCRAKTELLTDPVLPAKMSSFLFPSLSASSLRGCLLDTETQTIYTSRSDSHLLPHRLVLCPNIVSLPRSKPKICRDERRSDCICRRREPLAGSASAGVSGPGAAATDAGAGVGRGDGGGGSGDGRPHPDDHPDQVPQLHHPHHRPSPQHRPRLRPRPRPR